MPDPIGTRTPGTPGSRRNRARAWLPAGAVAVLAAACSLIVNSGLNGHPCGPGATCLSGYACNAKNVCVPPSQAQCSPACAADEVCVQQACVSKCDILACAPGSTCTLGACQSLPVTAGLGSPCGPSGADGGAGECNPPLTCLTPYGGNVNGVCTKVCDMNPDPCVSAGEVCTSYPSDQPNGIVNICADLSLRRCVSNADCSASEFVCGIAYIETPMMGWASASVCVPPATSGLSPGASCTLEGTPCADGLCILQGEGSLTNRYCSTPCSVATASSGTTECLAALTPPDGQSAFCDPVSISLVPGIPVTRAPLCVVGSQATTWGDSCSGQGSNCEADAPNCTASAANSSMICTPFCTQGPPSDQCASTEGSLMCNSANEICH